MLIRSEFAIEFNLPRPAAMVAMLRLHPSLDPLVRAPEQLLAEQVDALSQVAGDMFGHTSPG